MHAPLFCPLSLIFSLHFFVLFSSFLSSYVFLFFSFPISLSLFFFAQFYIFFPLSFLTYSPPFPYPLLFALNSLDFAILALPFSPFPLSLFRKFHSLLSFPLCMLVFFLYLIFLFSLVCFFLLLLRLFYFFISIQGLQQWC